jgi:hypothetical protein
VLGDLDHQHQIVQTREQGFHDAAHEAFKEGLRSRSRAAPIRHRALVQRAQNYLAQGKKSQARKESGARPGGGFKLRRGARAAG